jgi:hypothetical protein
MGEIARLQPHHPVLRLESRYPILVMVSMIQYRRRVKIVPIKVKKLKF